MSCENASPKECAVKGAEAVAAGVSAAGDAIANFVRSINDKPSAQPSSKPVADGGQQPTKGDPPKPPTESAPPPARDAGKKPTTDAQSGILAPLPNKDLDLPLYAPPKVGIWIQEERVPAGVPTGKKAEALKREQKSKL